MTEPPSTTATSSAGAHPASERPGSSPGSSAPDSSAPAQQPHGNHGSSPAAWSAVAVLLAAFVVWAIGMVIGPNWTLVWIGVALVPVGVLVGFVMSRMGKGSTSH